MFITILVAIIVNYFSTQNSNKLNNTMFEKLIPYNTKFNFYNDFYEDYGSITITSI